VPEVFERAIAIEDERVLHEPPVDRTAPCGAGRRLTAPCPF
jgi:hypothetical protein